MYRDDLAARGNLPIGKTSIPFPLDGKDVVLVDDVLYTGRTIRSAMDPDGFWPAKHDSAGGID